MTVWRVKINSGYGNDRVPWDGAKAYCRRVGVVGLGWGPPGMPDGASLETVLAAVDATPGWAPTGPQLIRRLAGAVKDHDLIWTRDKLGWYWLGRVEGPWRYDTSAEASRWDLNNVRECTWLSRGLHDYEVPGAIVRSFTGRGQSLCRVPDPIATRVTHMIWTDATDPSAPMEHFTPAEAISGLMDPTDVEDVVLLYLQVEGWLLLPSSRRRDTQVYEAVLLHADSGREAVVSVKSGRNNQVPIEQLRAAAGDAEPFAFSTHDAVSAPPEDHGVRHITAAELGEFMTARREVLPLRVSRWLA